MTMADHAFRLMDQTTDTCAVKGCLLERSDHRYRDGDERLSGGRRFRVVATGVRRRPRRSAEDLPNGATLRVGWLRWRRSSLNCFVADDLPRARLEIRRHVAWKKRPSLTPWKVNDVFGWCPAGEDRCFATPEEAMRKAGALAAEVIALLETRISRARRRRELHLE